MANQIISHLFNVTTETGDISWHIQSNDEHCLGVAEIAADFASEFGMGEWGRILGLLHDRGKERNGFQAYIKHFSGYDETAYSISSKDHSYIGAVIAHRLKMDGFFWLSNAIAGHHRGLYNIDELQVKLQESLPDEVSQAIPDIGLVLPKYKISLRDVSHIGRMLFSCLVDADWLDTEKFMNPEKASIRGNYSSMKELDNKLLDYRGKLKTLPIHPLNTLRNEIQQKCEEMASLEPGFFELTVPTGGGKTIASVIWGIRHALIFNKRRIIIAIPFTSIIVQTAAKLREIFGDENVIEHHSAMNESSADEKSLLACENWDAPIIVTTNVQLFESIYSNRPSACRKLHSIANSVVILDEVQTLPLTFLQPIVNAMKAYTKIFGTSFLFCTASQPILNGERNGCNGAKLIGIEKEKIRPIIREEMQLHDSLRRVRISFDNIARTHETLADILRQHKKVLCIVSSRRHALELYNELSKDAEVPIFHLSRSMCSAHILEKINEIKGILSDSDKEIRVVSTQLIEAGVDIDFPVVYRQLAGLDSILQAAGRCNREGKTIEGLTVVFSFEKDNQSGALKFASDTMKDMISLYPDSDWLSPETMRRYYERLYHRTPYFDKEGICDILDYPLSCQFEEASKKFCLINEIGINIIVNFGESEKIIRQLVNGGPARKLIRQLGRFSVNIPGKIFIDYRKAGLIEEPYPGLYYLPLKSQYDSCVGLKTENEYLEQTFII